MLRWAGGAVRLTSGVSELLPYLTSDLPGVGGTLRERPEDFFVQELPLYEPSGEGEHIYFEAQKVGINTRDAVIRIARALDIAPRDVGYAGLKDRHAVAQQLFSVPGLHGLDEERVMLMRADGVVPQWADRHGNKLRVGHLAGNRFAIRIRQCDPMAVVRLRPMLDRLAKHGLPNYYGEQRFGRDDQRPNDLLGLLLLRGDFKGFLDHYLGGDDGREDVAAARQIYDSGDHPAALRAWPMNIHAERRVLDRLVRTGDPVKAVDAIDRKIRGLYTSAAQSAVFNQVVGDRVRDGSLSTLKLGDVAQKHHDELRTGASFIVEDLATEQGRCDLWEISPTGPMPGRKMHPRPDHEAEEFEGRAMQSLGVSAEDFNEMPGARRSLRVRPIDSRLSSGIDDHGPHITVAFTLPAGSFATVLMREVMKGGEESR